MTATHSLQLFIGNKRYSSWSLRPWLYLKHHNVPFTEVPVRLDSPEMQSKLAGVTPAFRVPALVATSSDGQKLNIWDSLAIMEWASETFSPSGWPADAAARALDKTRFWLEIMEKIDKRDLKADSRIPRKFQKCPDCGAFTTLSIGGTLVNCSKRGGGKDGCDFHIWL